MANAITLKRRISSVRNTRQITKAMEMVSASKMRRAQESAVLGRDYRKYAHDLLTRLSAITEVEEHPLYSKRTVKNRLYIVVTSNSGLAGAYNSNVLRILTSLIRRDRSDLVASSIISVGKKGAQFTRSIEGVDLIAAYTEIGDNPDANSIRPILNTVADMYRDKVVDDVKLVFTQFKSNLVQEATDLSLLPASLPSVSVDIGSELDDSLNNTTFEPDIQSVLNNVTLRLLEVQLYQSILESIASEHSMRMIAMKNATDNASDLISDLTLAFNTARQAAITQELAEITGGAGAIAT